MTPWLVALFIVISFVLVAQYFTGGPIRLKPLEKEFLNPEHPYRVPAIVDSYEEPKPKPIKKKREPIVLPKSMIVFFILMPAMLVDIGMGFAYDSTALGIGAKWGMFAAAVLTNIFFIVSAIAKAEEKK